MEYEDLLVKANKATDPAVRMIYVSGFIYGQYSCTNNYRLLKPFNPLLGELFEIKCEKFKYISENVSSNPLT
jgi:hypothetical protein